jgi:hypothetical protein
LESRWTRHHAKYFLQYLHGAEKTSQRPQIELLAGFRGLAWSWKYTEEPASIQERSLLSPTDLKALGPEPAGLAIAACSGLRLHVRELLRRQQAAMKLRKITAVLELAVAYETAFLAWRHHYLGDLELLVQDLVGLGLFRDPKSVELRDVWSRAVFGLLHVDERRYARIDFLLPEGRCAVRPDRSIRQLLEGWRPFETRGWANDDGCPGTATSRYKRFYNDDQIDFEAGLGEFEMLRRDVLDRVGERCANGNREAQRGAKLWSRKRLRWRSANSVRLQPLIGTVCVLLEA